jgi:glycine dehydrogenase subunit 1
MDLAHAPQGARRRCKVSRPWFFYKEVSMPYTPHTVDDIKAMLTTLGINNTEALFDELPDALPPVDFASLPEAITEHTLMRLFQQALPDVALERTFIGAGAYPHPIPAAVGTIISRGEFLTGYTPYQAEASQGQLHVMYAFQSMMVRLLGMDVANASMYDGATALVEAILMAVRIARGKKRRVLCPTTLSLGIKEVLSSYLRMQSIEITWLDHDASGRMVEPEGGWGDVAALVIAQPNFLGVLEEVGNWVDRAHQEGCLSIAYVHPLSLSLLEAPGAWGESGVAIACGDGQSLGIPLSYGGPSFGFLACKQAYVRQLPGRIVGRTVDQQGDTAYTLTLQAREQHIRRDKATSNICTNQGLMVTAASVYTALMGPVGLREVVATSAKRHAYLMALLREVGITPAFTGPTLYETAVKLPMPAAQLIEAMANRGILAGYDLGRWDQRCQNILLLCTTEVHTHEDCHAYVRVMQSVLKEEVAC